MAHVDVFALLEQKELQNTVQVHDYNEAMSLLGKLGNVKGCQQILDAMRLRNMQVHRTNMNSIIAACAKAGDAKGAERYWKDMIDSGHWPNRATYASVIHGWARAGNLQRAQEWILAMQAAGLSPSKGFCRPIAVILLQEDAGNVDDDSEHDWVSSFRQRQLDNVSCKDDVRKADKATTWLLHFHRLGVALDRCTINLLASIFARNGEPGRVEQWFYHMAQAGISPNQSTYEALIVSHANAKNPERAEKWFEEMQEMKFEPPPAALAAIELIRSGTNSQVLLQRCILDSPRLEQSPIPEYQHQSLPNGRLGRQQLQKPDACLRAAADSDTSTSCQQPYSRSFSMLDYELSCGDVPTHTAPLPEDVPSPLRGTQWQSSHLQQLLRPRNSSHQPFSANGQSPQANQCPPDGRAQFSMQSRHYPPDMIAQALGDNPWPCAQAPGGTQLLSASGASLLEVYQHGVKPTGLLMSRTDVLVWRQEPAASSSHIVRSQCSANFGQQGVQYNGFDAASEASINTSPQRNENGNQQIPNGSVRGKRGGKTRQRKGHEYCRKQSGGNSTNGQAHETRRKGHGKRV